MAFLNQFLRQYIKNGMDDPAERDEKLHAHVERMSANADARLRELRQPTKPYGFWQSGANNAKFELGRDPSHNKLPGRAKQIDV